MCKGKTSSYLPKISKTRIGDFNSFHKRKENSFSLKSKIKIMHKEHKALDGNEYDVEIALKSGKLILSATNPLSTDGILVEIPPDKSMIIDNRIRQQNIGNIQR